MQLPKYIAGMQLHWMLIGSKSGIAFFEELKPCVIHYPIVTNHNLNKMQLKIYTESSWSPLEKYFVIDKIFLLF